MTLLQTYLGSKELKLLIVKRSEQFQIPLRHVCAGVGLDYSEFMRNYINQTDSTKAKITDGQFTKILELLGVDFHPMLVVRTDHPGKEVKKYLEKSYAEKKGTLVRTEETDISSEFFE